MDNIWPLQLRYVSQEYGSWKVLVVSSLLNQTHGIVVVHVVVDLFKEYPTPQAMVAADEALLASILFRLGFQHRRAKQLIKMSRQYIEIRRDLERGLVEPESLLGIGEYGGDAFRIFWQGKTIDDIQPKDKELRRYLEHGPIYERQTSKPSEDR